MAVFRPSARVRVQMRIDELEDLDPLKDKLEREPGKSVMGPGLGANLDKSSALQQNQQKRNNLASQAGKLASPDFAAQKALLDTERSGIQLAAPGGTCFPIKPLGLEDRPDDSRNVLFDMMSPMEIEINRNEVSDAHTARVMFNFRDIPVDPRSVRSALVSIALGTVPADEFKRGMLDKEERGDGSPLSLLEYTPGQELDFQSTTRFVGFVEEWRTEFDEDGDRLIMDCKDLSAVLRDKELPQGLLLDRTLPLADGVQQLIDTFPESRGLRVCFGVLASDDPLTSIGLEDRGPKPIDSGPRAQKSRGGKNSKAKKQGDKKMKLWDHLTAEVHRLGFIMVVRGFSVFILQAKDIFASDANLRKMVYGRNLSELQFARKLLGVQVPTIEIRSVDPDIGRTRWARFRVLDGEPTSGVLGVTDPVVSRPNKVSPNGTSEEKVLIQFVSGISDNEVLERIARNVYEQVGRQEIEGNFRTDDIESFRDPDDDRTASLPEADLLDLQPGEAVVIEVAPPAEVSRPEGFAVSAKPNDTKTSLQELAAQGAARRKAYLEQLGMEAETAQKLAAAQELIPLVNTFRAGYVNISWSNEDGVSIQADFHNFVVIRELEAERQVRLGVASFLDQAAAASFRASGR